MWYGNGWMFGMHYLWWIFWVVIIGALVVLLLRRPAAPPPATRDATALEILERRYAAGEITTQEFQERKALLKRS